MRGMQMIGMIRSFFLSNLVTIILVAALTIGGTLAFQQLRIASLQSANKTLTTERNQARASYDQCVMQKRRVNQSLSAYISGQIIIDNEIKRYKNETATTSSSTTAVRLRNPFARSN